MTSVIELNKLLEVMKRFEFSMKRCASLIHLSKLAFAVTILLALNLSMAPNVDAQRHGGGGRSFSGGSRSFSGGARIGRGFGGPRTFRSSPGIIGQRGYYGRGYYGRGFYGRGFHGRGVPYWRYGYFPFWGGYYWGIPPYALWFYLDGYNYYDSDGIYYRYDNNRYQVVPAPIGHMVKKLPKGSQEFTLDGVQYYYYFGSYYTPVGKKFEVVEPPIGAEVDSIPEGYNQVTIDGQTYYTLNGVQYKAVMRDNVIWYRVIKNNTNNGNNYDNNNNNNNNYSPQANPPAREKNMNDQPL